MYENTTRVVATIRARFRHYYKVLKEQTRRNNGSSYDENARQVNRKLYRQLHRELISANWCSYGHPDIPHGQWAFYAEIAGCSVRIALEQLPPATPVYLLDRQGDGEWTLFANTVGPQAFCTVLIIGRQDGREVIIDFHAGEPFAPELLSNADLDGMDTLGSELLQRVQDTERGKRIDLSLDEAIQLGFLWAKIP
jgi:hypothetical protein